MTPLVEIDGSFGEGGGQILRTALTLAAITGTPVRVYNIRAGRREPGLKPQHLVSARAACEVTAGTLEGAEPDSMELQFRPGAVKGGRFSFDVATAGSTGLVFQTILLPLCFANERSGVTISGGTHVEWSPPADFIKDVYLAAVRVSGVDAAIKVLRHGFYPRGGGLISLDINPSWPLKPINIIERGGLKRLKITARTANLPVEIAKRETAKIISRLKESSVEKPVEENIEEVASCGKGNFVFILAEFENIKAGFSALGRIGKRAEAVSDEAVEGLLKYLKGKAAVETHLSDQLVLPMALSKGESVITVGELSKHLLTNIHVIEKFLPVVFSIEERREVYTVRVKGAGRHV